jgi:lipoprotein NlpI
MGWRCLLAGVGVMAMVMQAAAESPSELFQEGVELFFAAKPVESSERFDALIKADPTAEPELWQRGLSLYYADRFQDGREQFESHRTVNPNDVENPAWHFACVARLEGLEAARKAMLPVGPDRRVPMKEIIAYYRGEGSPEEILAAAEAGDEAGKRNRLCYAHLYLGLFAEATGDADAAKQHISLAAGRYSMDHYMGRVAQVHARLRGWRPAE